MADSGGALLLQSSRNLFLWTRDQRHEGFWQTREKYHRWRRKTNADEEETMSAEATAWAWKQAKVCQGAATHNVLLALAEHASPDGICWPARRTIAKMCGYDSLSSVTRKINNIISLGLLVREERYVEKPNEHGKRRQTSNVYRLQMPVVEGGEHDDGPPEEHPTTPGQTPLAPGAKGGVQQVLGDPLSPGANPGTLSSETTTGNNNGSSTISEDEEVAKVWEHYCKVFEVQRAKLGPNRIQGIKKALKEAPLPTLLLAIDGLKNYRAHKPGKTTLETIWQTYKNTGSVVERIEFFASQAKGSVAGGKQFPSAQPAIVAQRQLDVQRGHGSSNEEFVERAKESEAWLLEHGIETARRDDGYPVFRALTGGGAAE